MSTHYTTLEFEFELERPLATPAANGDTHTVTPVTVTATVSAAVRPSGPRGERHLDPGREPQITRLTVTNADGQEVEIDTAEYARIESDVLDKFEEMEAR